METSNNDQFKLPKGDFALLVQSLATNALVHLGTMDPKIEKNLEISRLNIDFLETLDQKTKGNLDGNEASLLNAALNQCKTSFVQASK